MHRPRWREIGRPFRSFSLLGSIAHEEKETAPLLKEGQGSDPVSTNLLVYEDDGGSKLPSFVPFVREIAISAEGELKDSAVLDKSSIQIDLHQATPLEEDRQTASILSEGEEKEASDPGESVAVEDAVTSDPFALSEIIIHEEKEITSPLEEYQDSNHARKDLLVYKNGFDGSNRF